MVISQHDHKGCQDEKCNFLSGKKREAWSPAISQCHSPGGSLRRRSELRGAGTGPGMTCANKPCDVFLRKKEKDWALATAAAFFSPKFDPGPKPLQELKGAMNYCNPKQYSPGTVQVGHKIWSWNVKHEFHEFHFLCVLLIESNKNSRHCSRCLSKIFPWSLRGTGPGCC